MELSLQKLGLYVSLHVAGALMALDVLGIFAVCVLPVTVHWRGQTRPLHYCFYCHEGNLQMYAC